MALRTLMADGSINTVSRTRTLMRWSQKFEHSQQNSDWMLDLVQHNSLFGQLNGLDAIIPAGCESGLT
jgi:hypothetical protein